MINSRYIAGALLCGTLLFGAYWTLQSELFRGKLPAEKNSGEFIEAGPFRVAVTIDPEKPRVGKNTLSIRVRSRDGQPVSGAQVRAMAEMPAMGTMAAMRAPAELTETAPGTYRGELELSMAGAWPLAVDIATGHDKHVDLVFDMTTSRSGLRLTTAPQPSDTAYYTCSMHPSVKSAAPGSCPICGMDLVAVSREELQSGSIVVDAGQRQAIGVKTGTVQRKPFAVSLRLQGKITYDETRLADITLRFDGWIGELRADFTGKPVQRGDLLFTVYSPELLSLQEEYLQSQRRGGALVKAARKRLRLWGLSAQQIDWLGEQKKARDYVPIFAPSSGVIVEKNIVAGSAYKKGQRLLRLADLSTVWLEAFAYEQDLPLIETGMPAKIALPDGEQATGEVMQVDPFLDSDTRTARVRFALLNGDGHYRPGTFAEVTLRAELGQLLQVPEDAVLVTGHKRFVFVDLGEGRLQPVRVRTGYSDGENIVVRSGLDEGERIVTSGVFLIAAESRLKSGLAQW